MKPLHFPHLNAVETATLLYLVLTGIFIGFNFSVIENSWFHLLARLIMIAIIFLAAWLRENVKKLPAWPFLYNAYPLLFLAYLYPETDALNNVFFQNLDMRFVYLEYSIFGFQPSIEFYKHFPSPWLVELMSFGYFSYYLLIFGGLIWIYFKNKNSFERAVFIVCSSFYLYYIIFIIFPVVGPQFFFSSPDNFVGEAGPFRWAMHWIEYLGERPTAAFPSSHVGITVIILILIFKEQKIFSLTLLPISFLLALSTVYLKAHYVVDVFAGLVTGFLFYCLFNFIYSVYRKENNGTVSAG
jgi:membrane-associated phospholipid phosphatase